MPLPPLRALERRRGKRYPACLPAVIKLTDTNMAESFFSALTQNLSQNGVLLYSNSRLPEGSAVELTINKTPDPLLLTLKGKILRVTPHPRGTFAIAVACDFPLNLFRPWP